MAATEMQCLDSLSRKTKQKAPLWLTERNAIRWSASLSDIQDKLPFIRLKQLFLGSFQPMTEPCGLVKAIQDFTDGPSLIENCPLGYLIPFQVCVLAWSLPSPSPPPFSFRGIRVGGRYVLLSSAPLSP